jgi:hypothetical protein
MNEVTPSLFEDLYYEVWIRNAYLAIQGQTLHVFE